MIGAADVTYAEKICRKIVFLGIWEKFTVLEEAIKISNSNADCAKDLSNEKMVLSGICPMFTATNLKFRENEKKIPWIWKKIKSKSRETSLGKFWWSIKELY